MIERSIQSHGIVRLEEERRALRDVHRHLELHPEEPDCAQMMATALREIAEIEEDVAILRRQRWVRHVAATRSGPPPPMAPADIEELQDLLADARREEARGGVSLKAGERLLNAMWRRREDLVTFAAAAFGRGQPPKLKALP